MKLSGFSMPCMVPGAHTLKEICDWTVQTIIWAEQFGFEEYWVGEHFTLPAEPVAAPDLLIAQALVQTDRIKLGPGGHCLPYHHPVSLAHRIAQLDHMAQGRYQFGIAAGSVTGDLAFYGIDGRSGQQREMTAESLEIILAIWSADPDIPFDYNGKYWTVHYPGRMLDGAVRGHLKPFQRPHPPISISGLTPYSGTLKLAGANGFIPMSLNMSPKTTATHWLAVQEGAAKTGLTPTRRDWRILKEVFIADTDAEARKIATEGPIAGFMMGEWLPTLLRNKMGHLLYQHEDMTDADLTLDYLVDNAWLVGSPATVTEKIETMYDALGGFGYLMPQTFDFASMPTAWHDSLGLLVEQVLPRVAHLVPSD